MNAPTIGSVVMWQGDRGDPGETALVIEEQRAEGAPTRPVIAYRLRFFTGGRSWVSVSSVRSLEE